MILCHADGQVGLQKVQVWAEVWEGGVEVDVEENTAAYAACSVVVDSLC